MKITKSQFEQIIIEELDSAVREAHGIVVDHGPFVERNVKVYELLAYMGLTPHQIQQVKDILELNKAEAEVEKSLGVKLEERCQKGYKTHPKRKTKKMFGRTYRNCVKAEGLDEKDEPTKLTEPEIKKRKEIADAIKKDNPGISDDKKFSFATATVKKRRKKK